MHPKHPHRREVLTAGAIAAVWPHNALAQQDPAAFYRGKTISIVMGTGPGGSYESYGRLIAAHLGRHIPGNPNVLVEFLPGAGGALAGNNIFALAAQDGSKILLAHPLPMIEKMEPASGIRFDSTKFQWLGVYAEDVQVLALWRRAAVDPRDITGPGLVLGAMGRTHSSYQWAKLVKDAIGASYDIVSGYTTGGALNLAMEGGEINGWVITWEGVRQDWLRDDKVGMPVQFALERIAALPDTPTILEIVKPETRDIVKFLLSASPIARSLAVGPGVPADRVAALRKALADMLKDQAFLNEAKQRNLSIHYRNAEETQALVEFIANAPPQLVARAKQAVGAPER